VRWERFGSGGLFIGENKKSSSEGREVGKGFIMKTVFPSLPSWSSRDIPFVPIREIRVTIFLP
jgi:hypothetical protein